MTSNFEMVREFHENFGHPVSTVPHEVDDDVLADLRIDLIREEFDELLLANSNCDLIGLADAMTDMLYVIYGMGHVYGIDLDRCFAEVHRSNMSKLGHDGKPVMRPDGKILKGPGYSPPDLKTVLGIE